MPSLRHTHTYERMKSRKDYFRCINPDCTHFMHKEMMKGKRAICPCGNEYFLNAETLKLFRPHCAYCGKGARRPKITDNMLLSIISPELLRPENISPDGDESYD